MSGKIRIEQENSYDLGFENEEALENYLEEIEKDVSKERLNKIISLKERQNG